MTQGFTDAEEYTENLFSNMTRTAAAMITMLTITMVSSCGIFKNTSSSQAVEPPKRSESSIPKVDPAPIISSAPAQKVEESGLQMPENSGIRSEVIRYAKTKLGCKYRAAGTGPDSFDCSGFTRFVFSHFKVTLPHSSRDQFKEGVEIKDGDPLKPGDLVFWAGRAGSSVIGHVGIVVEYKTDGTFTFIHAASDGIRIDRSVAQYYASRYKGARRIILD